MNEFFNFGGTWIVVQENWVWMLASLGLGIWVGWASCSAGPDESQDGKG
jgi:hypothetical protein